jgi:hypothetical protein
MFRVRHSNQREQLEVCIYCGHKDSFLLDDINKARGWKSRYWRSHLRSFCQPQGLTEPIYRMIYGYGVKTKAEQEHERRIEKETRHADWEIGTHEKFQHAINNPNFDPKRSTIKRRNEMMSQ